MAQEDEGYNPEITYVAENVPIRWEITSTSPYSCAAYIRSPEMGVRTNLKAGKNVINIPALKNGNWQFTCVMGMYSGKFIAVKTP
jgi:plastocyanin domain-containing protein